MVIFEAAVLSVIFFIWCMRVAAAAAVAAAKYSRQIKQLFAGGTSGKIKCVNSYVETGRRGLSLVSSAKSG